MRVCIWAFEKSCLFIKRNTHKCARQFQKRIYHLFNDAIAIRRALCKLLFQQQQQSYTHTHTHMQVTVAVILHCMKCLKARVKMINGNAFAWRLPHILLLLSSWLLCFSIRVRLRMRTRRAGGYCSLKAAIGGYAW